MMKLSPEYLLDVWSAILILLKNENGEYESKFEYKKEKVKFNEITESKGSESITYFYYEDGLDYKYLPKEIYLDTINKHPDNYEYVIVQGFKVPLSEKDIKEKEETFRSMLKNYITDIYNNKINAL